MLEFLLKLDYTIFNLINVVFTHDLLDVFFFWITDLHKTIYFKIIIIPLVIFLFIKKYKKQGWILFSLLIVALSLSDFVGGKIKHVISRERPENNVSVTVIKRSDAGSFSFYSNHTSNMFTFATYTSQFIPQLKIPLYAIASLVAYSRVYNGVHYPSDVFAGSIIGYLWGYLFSRRARRLIEKLNSRNKKQ